ncbi:MAG: HD domain-containing phosphohydrolase [Candidatus Omnitrophota bacterium]
MERLFYWLRKNWNKRHEITTLSKYLKNPVCVLLSVLPEEYADFKNSEAAKCIKKEIGNQRQFRKAINEVLKNMKKSWKNKSLELFDYCGQSQGLCYPFMFDGKVFGLVFMCCLKKKMSSEFLTLFASVIDAAVRESRKELELEELNKTIRPRAIALSTVHTVHRLMTSTLSLNELLPRIARLSLQIIKANRCSIKIVDKKRRILLPKSTVDLRKAKTKLKKVAIGKYAPGRAVKHAMSIRSHNFLATPMVDDDVVGVITLYDKLDKKEFTQFDEEIMKTLAEQAAIAIKNTQLYHEQQDLTFSSIKCIAQLIEARPHGTHRAEASFMKLLRIIGRKFNMNEHEIRMLQYAAMLHDAGQISIPEKLLSKKGGLTGSEYDIIKKHPMKGADILSKFKPLKPIVPIILYHHENYDGTGYPKGLKGKEIPLPARILGVAGAFEAMIIEKPYRKALSISSAIKEVRKNAGKQFDPEVVEVFCEAVNTRNVRKLLEKELGIHG